MRTYNVSNSCDVLWVSRQNSDQVRALFSSTSSIFVTSLKDVVEQLINAGAQWLNSDFNVGLYDKTDANYLRGPGDFNSDVMHCTWSKDTTSAAGVFQIQLKPRVPYGDMIAPGDLFIIFMDNDHQFSIDNRTHGTLETIAIVERVGEGSAADSDGATVETVAINGRDLGMIFSETETVFDKAFAVIEQQFFDSQYITKISDVNVSAQSPIEIVMTILDLIYNQNATGSKIAGLQWSMPSGQDGAGRPVSLLSLLNVRDFVQVPMVGYTLASSLGIAQAGNVWTLLTSYANRVVNEFFVDVRDLNKAEFELLDHLGGQASKLVGDDDVAKQTALADQVGRHSVFNQSSLRLAAESSPDSSPVMALVHRQMPFDRDAFARLPVNEVRYDEAPEFDVNKSSHDVVNYFKVRFPDLPEGFQELTYGLKINLDSIARFGVKRMEAETRYAFASSDASASFSDGQGSPGDFVDVIKFYIGLLSTWYAANEYMLSGSVGCRFRPEIRVGTRLKYIAMPKDEEQGDSRVFSFYVQGVSHVFSVAPGASRTTLTCVRGVEEAAGGLPNNLIWDPSQLSPKATQLELLRSAVGGSNVDLARTSVASSTSKGDGNRIPSNLVTFKTVSILESL